MVVAKKIEEFYFYFSFLFFISLRQKNDDNKLNDSNSENTISETSQEQITEEEQETEDRTVFFLSSFLFILSNILLRQYLKISLLIFL
jgi:hypothetical protein